MLTESAFFLNQNFFSSIAVGIFKALKKKNDQV